MHACSTFFHQGSDLCQDLDPFLKKLAENVSLLSLVKWIELGLELGKASRFLPVFI